MAITNKVTSSQRNGAGEAPKVLIVALVVSGVAFGYPFLVPFIATAGLRQPALPVLGVLILSIAVAITIGLAWTRGVSNDPRPGAGAKFVALVSAIVAIDAVLRLIPSFSGASAVFPLMILAGAVFGAHFGFLAGSLTLLVSAVLTAGVGPWLPFQMLAAGWVGASAALLPRQLYGVAPRIWLPVCGALAGIGYGVLMSLYAWPLAAPGVAVDASLFWAVDLSPSTLLGRYAVFYAVTSLPHDLTRAIGNAVLLVVFGPPLLRMLIRARDRVDWTQAPS